MRAPRFTHAPSERYGTMEQEAARADAMHEDYKRRNPEKAAVLEQYIRGEITGEEASRRIEEINRKKEEARKAALECLKDRMDEEGIPVE